MKINEYGRKTIILYWSAPWSRTIEGHHDFRFKDKKSRFESLVGPTIRGYIHIQHGCEKKFGYTGFLISNIEGFSVVNKKDSK